MIKVYNKDFGRKINNQLNVIKFIWKSVRRAKKKLMEQYKFLSDTTY